MPCTPDIRAISRDPLPSKTNFESVGNKRFPGVSRLDEHVYVDEALCGVGAERPGLCRLLAAALSSPRPFDVILVDDSSRLSRNTANALSMFEKLSFAGVRLIAISQGIDSQHEQAQVSTSACYCARHGR